MRNPHFTEDIGDFVGGQTEAICVKRFTVTVDEQSVGAFLMAEHHAGIGSAVVIFCTEYETGTSLPVPIALFSALWGRPHCTGF